MSPGDTVTLRLPGSPLLRWARVVEVSSSTAVVELRDGTRVTRSTSSLQPRARVMWADRWAAK